MLSNHHCPHLDCLFVVLLAIAVVGGVPDGEVPAHAARIEVPTVNVGTSGVLILRAAITSRYSCDFEW